MHYSGLHCDDESDLGIQSTTCLLLNNNTSSGFYPRPAARYESGVEINQVFVWSCECVIQCGEARIQSVLD